jgi:hypothetical protein
MILYEQVMASKFSGSNFLELAIDFDTWRFFWRQHFWSQSSPCLGCFYCKETSLSLVRLETGSKLV